MISGNVYYEKLYSTSSSDYCVKSKQKKESNEEKFVDEIRNKFHQMVEEIENIEDF